MMEINSEYTTLVARDKFLILKNITYSYCDDDRLSHFDGGVRCRENGSAVFVASLNRRRGAKARKLPY